MKFATYHNGQPDGQLMVVSRDLSRAVDASSIAPDLLHALQHWEELAPALQRLSDALNDGDRSGAGVFDPARCMAPLPRTFQWCDASAFLNHGHLMERAFNTEPIPDFDTVPVMYQGASDDFLGPCVPVPMPDEALGIDFEGEFGVVTGALPMGVTSDLAERAIRLVVQLNDWSLRALAGREMRAGFGFLQAKPSTSFAPVAVTPDELGDAWRDGRVQLDLEVSWNDVHFGRPNGGEMHYSFGELLAHAARTRKLGAGTILGSGTVSNAGGERGSACIAERRVIEILAQGAPLTAFMRFGDRVRMCARTAGGEAPFGAIDQRVVAAGETQRA
ncbi:fumarylacetoacetate hydrolase family protein [Janthinobacterium sp. UMAB-56]|uniref:fumarylacetoacetate hydrolase family protein n=1 Tax=Janthinobacterium sp. UMAB-56 TaxID=1365361 RepID=UPI001C56968B|nr:fumarylacetoacetate hydrolase family protein [Janthinobacterium sp. UMAB-56]